MRHLNIASSVLTLVTFSVLASFPCNAAEPLNLIQQENVHAGTHNWRLRREFRSKLADADQRASKDIVRSRVSKQVNPSTSWCRAIRARAFKVEFFRTGYGGRGARLMKTIDRVEGVTQPTPAAGEKDLHECQWKASLSLTIP